MPMRRGIPLALMILLMLFIYASSILLVDAFESYGVRAFEKPEDPMNVLYFISILLVLTFIIILIAKFSRKEIIYLLFIFAILSTTFTVFEVILHRFLLEPLLAVVSIALSTLIAFLLVVYPEWYIIDISGTILCIGAIVMFGISLSIPLTIVLLIVLAIYDAISVYKTKHMIDLADAVVDLKLPALFIIPHSIKYRFRKQPGGLKKQIKRKERDAFFVGLGDVVMPGIMVVSSYKFTGSLLISSAVVAGIVVSFIVLMVYVSRGRAHAGLPFLNTGAIMGYLVSSLLIYRTLVGFSI